MNVTTANTKKARSSHVRSIERRVGVSMAEVVMDDMADGDPVFLSAQLPLLSLLPPAPYIAYPVPSNWEFPQIVFCDAIS